MLRTVAGARSVLSKCQLLLGIKEESQKLLAYISSRGGKEAKKTALERLQNGRIFVKQSRHTLPLPRRHRWAQRQGEKYIQRAMECIDEAIPYSIDSRLPPHILISLKLRYNQ